MHKKLSAWNLFVKKIYAEGKAKNPKMQFKDALKEASRRKGEMGSASSSGPTKKNSKSRKGGKRKRGTRKRSTGKRS